MKINEITKKEFLRSLRDPARDKAIRIVKAIRNDMRDIKVKMSPVQYSRSKGKQDLIKVTFDIYAETPFGDPDYIFKEAERLIDFRMGHNGLAEADVIKDGFTGNTRNPQTITLWFFKQK